MSSRIRYFSSRSAAVIAVAMTVLCGPVAHATEASESTYTSGVRATLERNKRFPTGREVSLNQPKGASEVTFVLDRRGKVKSATISKTSNSQPLDAMAVTLVKRARYAPFPADVWEGSATKRFAVNYNFTPTKQGTVTLGEPTEVIVR